MKPDEKLNAFHQAETTSILKGFLPGSANLETDRSVPPAGDFEESIAELLHGEHWNSFLDPVGDRNPI